MAVLLVISQRDFRLISWGWVTFELCIARDNNTEARGPCREEGYRRPVKIFLIFNFGKLSIFRTLHCTLHWTLHWTLHLAESVNHDRLPPSLRPAFRGLHTWLPNQQPCLWSTSICPGLPHCDPGVCTRLPSSRPTVRARLLPPAGTAFIPQVPGGPRRSGHPSSPSWSNHTYTGHVSV